MLQALEHNVRTSLADVDTLTPILAVRGVDVRPLQHVRTMLEHAADDLHRLFAEAVADHPHVSGCTHPDDGHEHPHGVAVAE